MTSKKNSKVRAPKDAPSNKKIKKKTSVLTIEKVEYVDYKDVELLKKLVNRHGRIVGRRKTGCTAVSQHTVSQAIKRARFMGLLPYTGE